MYEATLKFINRNDAESFAKAYSRHTLRGHIISPDNSVKVYSLSEDDKKWIDSYCAKLNERNK